MRPPEQTFIPGTEPPPNDEPDVEEVKAAIYAWLDAKTQQKRAGEETRAAHAKMLEELKAAGIEWHPYLDPSTLKKRRVWVAKEPKARTTAVPRPRGEGRNPRRARGGADREADAEVAPAEDTSVEFRRVPRSSVEKEVDGFASIREQLDAKKARGKKGGKS